MKQILLSLCLVCCDTIAAQPAYTLQQLKDSALHNNIAIRSARHAIDAASEQRREAFTRYFPSVSATGLWFNANKPLVATDVNPAEALPTALTASLAQTLPAEALAALSSPFSIGLLKNGVLGGITALQPIFAGGQIVNGNRLAKVGEEASRLQLQLSENEVEKQTEQYYWQLVTLQEKLRTIDAVDTLLADIAKDVSVAIRAGVALHNDLLQVQLRQNDMQSQRLKLDNGISIVSLLLAQFCGLSSSLEFRVESVEFATAFDGSADTSADRTAVANSKLSTLNSQLPTLNSTLDALPEYQLLEKQVEAATLQKRLAVGRNLPTVAVGAGYNYHNLMETGQTRAMLFATVTVPISDWWGGSHAIRRHKIGQQQAIEQLNDTAERLQIRAQNAWNSVVEARAQLDLSQRGIEQATENLRLHRDYYQAGTATMSDLLEAQLLLQQTLDRRTDAFATLQNSLLEYRQSVGQ